MFWTGLCLGTELICRFLLRWSYPYDYPAMPFSVMFGDFHDYVTKFFFFHSKAFFTGQPLTYPAPAVARYRLFVLDGGRHVRTATYSYIGFALLTFVCGAVVFGRSLVRRGVAPRSAKIFAGTALLLSFPVWFELHQGNIEAMVWVFTSLGLWAVDRSLVVGFRASGKCGGHETVSFYSSGAVSASASVSRAVSGWSDGGSGHACKPLESLPGSCV